MRGMDENPYRAPREQGAEAARLGFPGNVRGAAVAAAASLAICGGWMIYLERTPQQGLTWWRVLPLMVMVAAALFSLVLGIWQNPPTRS